MSLDPARLRAEYARFLVQEASHALTLVPNRDLSIEEMRDLFGKFCLEVDRLRFRRSRVIGIASEDRFQARGVIEKPDIHIHIHAAIRLQPWLGQPVTPSTEAELHRIWRRLTRGAGDSCLRADLDDLWGLYCTKEWSWIDRVVLSADFHPHRVCGMIHTRPTPARALCAAQTHSRRFSAHAA